MKTRSKFIQRVWIFLVLTALTLGFSIPVSASASSTTLITVVPSCFIMDVMMVGDGSVIINGNKLTQPEQISIERHQRVEIVLLPGDNNHIESIMYNGTSFTDRANDGSLVLPELKTDAELIVTFAVNQSTPNTGDESFPQVICYGIIAIISLFAIILLTVKKKCYN